MRRVVHRRQPRPSVRPALHVLVVAALQKLNPTELAAAIELARVEILPRVENRFGHHIFEPGPLNELDNLTAFVDGEGHWHGADDVFPSIERSDRHPTVVGEGRVDVDEIDFTIGEHVFETLIAPFDSKCVADCIEGGFGPPTDRVHVG